MNPSPPLSWYKNISFQLGKLAERRALIFFFIVLACMIPIPITWMGMDYTMVYKKPIILLAGVILLLFDSKKSFYISKIEIFFFILILFQIVSAVWAFSLSALLLSIVEDLFLLLLLIWFAASGVSTRSIARIFLFFNTMLVVSLLVFWTNIYFEEGYLSLTEFDKVGKYFGYNNNYLGAMLALTFPVYPWILRQIKLQKDLILILIFFHVLVLASLNSRLSLIIVLATGVFFLMNTKSIKRFVSRFSVLFIVSFGLLLVITLSFHDQQAFFRELNPFRLNGERIEIWRLTLSQLFINNPILGSGSNSWHLLFPTTDLSSFDYSLFETRSYNHAHNIFIEKVAELGLIGMIPFLLFTLWPLYQFSRIKNKKALEPFFLMYVVYLILAFFYGVVYIKTSFSGPTILWIFSIYKINEAFQSEHSLLPIRYHLPKWILTLLFCVCAFYQGCKLYQHRQYILYKSAIQHREVENAEARILNTYNKCLFPNYSSYSSSATLISHFYIKRDPAKSLFWMEQAMDDQPYNLQYMLRSAELLENLEKFEKAKNMYREILGLNYTIIEASLGLARIALIQNDEDVFNERFGFANELVTGLLRSREKNRKKEYLKHDKIYFWERIEKLKNQVDNLELRSKETFKDRN